MNSNPVTFLPFEYLPVRLRHSILSRCYKESVDESYMCTSPFIRPATSRLPVWLNYRPVMKSDVCCQFVTVRVFIRQSLIVLSEQPLAMQNYLETLKTAQETIPRWVSSYIGPRSFKFHMKTFMSAPAVSK